MDRDTHWHGSCNYIRASPITVGDKLMDIAGLVAILDQETVPAVGCTEPVAIALTSAAAMNAVGGRLHRLELVMSVSIFKNARSVGIPGSADTGVELAAMLGAAIARPEAGLEILSYVDPSTLELARVMLKTVDLHSRVDSERSGVYVRCTVVTDNGEAAAETVDRHDNVRIVALNGERVPVAPGQRGQERQSLRRLAPFRELAEAVYDAPESTFGFLIARANANLDMANAGLDARRGLGIGRFGEIAPRSHASYAAAACDARMSGLQKPVCTCAGSGNLGISATVPVLAAGGAEGASLDLTARSLALSLATTIYVKEHFGLLSPVCGCAVAAGTGTAAGLVMLRGGDVRRAEDAASTVLATLAGMLCDGGKVGCAMKVWASVITAEKAAALALAGVRVPPGNGIVGETIDQTLSALENVVKGGLADLDRVVIMTMC